MSRLEAIKGSIPPVVTPFRDGAVDYEAYAGLVEFQVSEGSHGVLVNGTTAEPSTLTTEERNRLVDVAIETLRVTNRHDTPWMIYHIPGRTAISVTLDSMKELRDKSPTFVGMKHAVNDLGFVTECLSTFGDDFKIFVGLEELSFPMMTIGACGLMNAVGNLRPNVLSDMCQAVWDSDLKKGRELHQRLLEINQAVFYDTNPIPMKYMMKRLGLMPANEHRLPMMPATPELEKRLDGVLERAGLLKGIAA
jgi:4-hydroxy-tetrahydrodipicolinate synthase